MSSAQQALVAKPERDRNQEARAKLATVEERFVLLLPGQQLRP